MKLNAAWDKETYLQVATIEGSMKVEGAILNLGIVGYIIARDQVQDLYTF